MMKEEETRWGRMQDCSGREISVYGRRDNGNVVWVSTEYLYGAIKKKEWNIDEWAVFSSTKYPGEPLSPNTVREWVKLFTKRHGLPKFHPHQFRHTAISLQLQAGISVADIAKRAGHARPDVTVNTRYGHTHPVQPYSITKHGSEPLNNADRSLSIQNTITVILLWNMKKVLQNHHKWWWQIGMYGV